MEKENVLRVDDVAIMLGLTRSYIYKLVAWRKIPHYKPTGKIVFFKRDEVEAWALGNRIPTSEELNNKALNYCQSNK